MLWEVRRGDAVSYLFGTLHAGVSLSDLPGSVVTAMDGCSAVVVEADTSAMQSPSIIAKMMLPPDQSLAALLGKKDWNTLLKHLGDVLPPNALDRFQPWTVSILLTTNGVIDTSKPGLDTEISLRAKEQQKRMLYLETVEEQLALIGGAITLDELRETLRDVTLARQGFMALVRAYKSGNAVALTGLVFDQDEVAERRAYYDRIFFARNRAWMSILGPLFDQGDHFVAVGVGHNLGDEGLVVLLREAGYGVRRILKAPSGCRPAALSWARTLAHSLIGGAV